MLVLPSGACSEPEESFKVIHKHLKLFFIPFDNREQRATLLLEHIVYLPLTTWSLLIIQVILKFSVNYLKGIPWCTH